ncbi:PoNe immunity protein domain-containing protein [Sphingobacterium kyonggiense]
MRVDIKDLEYFKNYIELNVDDIKFYKEGLANNTTPKDRIWAVKRSIFTTSLHTVIAMYSSGLSIEEMKNEFKNTINYLRGGWENSSSEISLDDYVLIIWMLSLGILLHADDSDFNKIVDVLDKSQQSDGILDLIISNRITNRKINSNLLYPNQFEFLKTLYETKNLSSLKEYLDKKWYGKFASTYWYQNDKNKNEVFFGYWSFESGAMVKILGLDDSLIKDQQYYPYDLVHWKG